MVRSTEMDRLSAGDLKALRDDDFAYYLTQSPVVPSYNQPNDWHIGPLVECQLALEIDVPLPPLPRDNAASPTSSAPWTTRLS